LPPTGRDSANNDKLAWNLVALIVPPCLDCLQIAGAHAGSGVRVKACPRQRHRAAHKSCVASLICVGVAQRCGDAVVLRKLELRVKTQISQRLRLPEAKK
jgi:hypothetical protein